MKSTGRIIIKIAAIPVVFLGFVYELLRGFFLCGMSLASGFCDWMDLS